MLKRYSVVIFQTIQTVGRDRVAERGGGVCFVPIDERASWPVRLAEIVREHFRRPLGRSVEVGLAQLDEDVLASVCHRSGTIYWQGADS